MVNIFLYAGSDASAQLIFAIPFLIPVISPLLFTDAISGSVLFQIKLALSNFAVKMPDHPGLFWNRQNESDSPADISDRSSAYREIFELKAVISYISAVA